MASERTVIEQDTFRAAREALRVNCKQLDDALEEITLNIARLPDYYPYVPPGKTLRRCRTRAFSPNIPAYDILFTFDEDTVTLLYIDRADPRHLPNPGAPENWS